MKKFFAVCALLGVAMLGLKASADQYADYPNGGNTQPGDGILVLRNEATIYTTFPSLFSPSGSAGGDLCGTYPNPTLCNTPMARNDLGLGLTAALNGPIRITREAMREYELCASSASGANTTLTPEKTGSPGASRSGPPIFTKPSGA